MLTHFQRRGASTAADRRERWFYSYLPTNMAGGCFDTLLPLFVVLTLHGNVGQVAAVSVAASAASVPALMFWGAATDAFKWRKHFIVVGFVGRAVAYAAMGLSVDVDHLLFANILMGLLSAASGPAMSILIFETFSKGQWAEKTGRFNNVAGIGNLAGIALGVLWLAAAPTVMDVGLALRLLFFVSAVLALIGGWLALILVTEPKEKLSREDFHNHAVQLARWAAERARYLPDKIYRFFRWSHIRDVAAHHEATGGHFGGFLASSFVYTIGAVSFFTIVPVYLIEVVGTGEAAVFALSFVQALASTLLFSRVGRLLDRYDKPRALFLAKTSRLWLFAFYAIAALVASWNALSALVLLCVLHIMMGVTWAVIGDVQMPVAVSSSSEGNKGAHAGTFNASVGLGAIAGGALGGILATGFGYQMSMTASAVVVGLSAAILYATVPFEKGRTH
jgi:MFS family permease